MKQLVFFLLASLLLLSNAHGDEVANEEPDGPPSNNPDSEIVFAAVFLDWDSAEALKDAFPPVHPNTYYEHMTISYQPRQDVLEVLQRGTQVSLKVVGYAADDKGQAVLVAPSIPLVNTQERLHVTLSTADGVGAAYSTELFNRVGERPVLVDLELTGTVCFANSYQGEGSYEDQQHHGSHDDHDHHGSHDHHDTKPPHNARKGSRRASLQENRGPECDNPECDPENYPGSLNWDLICSVQPPPMGHKRIFVLMAVGAAIFLAVSFCALCSCRMLRRWRVYRAHRVSCPPGGLHVQEIEGYTPPIPVVPVVQHGGYFTVTTA